MSNAKEDTREKYELRRESRDDPQETLFIGSKSDCEKMKGFLVNYHRYDRVEQKISVHKHLTIGSEQGYINRCLNEEGFNYGM